MDCPVCNEAMMVVERHQIELDLCFFGHGFWFDLSELEMLPEAIGLPVELPKELLYKEKVDITSLEAKRKCPRCKTLMDKILLSDDLLVDRCPKLHGFWFDKGEL
ncbi:MAG: zf-TFIIB domain-containing protein, partial [Candidatus Caenarcaniphilales bacterium]|nr:zf-TFIIB domain-containing protein [Candidatus Caenarcaniphilales bacterium]